MSSARYEGAPQFGTIGYFAVTELTEQGRVRELLDARRRQADIVRPVSTATQREHGLFIGGRAVKDSRRQWRPVPASAATATTDDARLA